MMEYGWCQRFLRRCLPDKASHIVIYNDNGEVIKEYKNVWFDEIEFPQEKLIVYQTKDGTKRASYTNLKWEIEKEGR